MPATWELTVGRKVQPLYIGAPLYGHPLNTHTVIRKSFVHPSHTFSLMVDPNTVNSVILFSFLGPAIDANGGLEYLNLSWNHFRGKGGVAIGKGLRANCSLQTLDISWNGLADEGAAAFGESLKENNTLIDLDLTNNRISTEGALAFAKGLQINNTLKILRFVT